MHSLNHSGWRLALLALQALNAALVGASGASGFPSTSYDVIVLGSGLKESLLAGLLAQHGKRVLQLGGSDDPGGGGASMDLQQLSDALEGPGAAALSEQKLGKLDEYSVERAPKVFMATGNQVQVFVKSGAWRYMNPPGFKRVQRSLLYRTRADGTADVHRVLANSEDIVKTRMLAPLEKARMLQFYLWVEKYDEADPRTHVTGPLSKRSLDLYKMSAAKFLAFWELPAEAVPMLTRGMALLALPSAKRLKRMPAIELVRRLKRYRDAYRTFPHMTSPYVYPVGGFGASLNPAMGRVLEAHGGCCLLDKPIDELRLGDGGEACGVVSGGVELSAGCVVAAPEHAPRHVAPSYHIVRLYAVLAHAPNLCKDSTSCQLLLPAAQCAGRQSDVYLVSLGPTHGVAPKGKWVVVASARVEGDADGDALAIAKRELAEVLPLLKPTRRLLAEVTPYYEPSTEGEAPPPEGLHVLTSTDETSYFDSVEEDIEAVFKAITGERLAGHRFK